MADSSESNWTNLKPLLFAIFFSYLARKNSCKLAEQTEQASAFNWRGQVLDTKDYQHHISQVKDEGSLWHHIILICFLFLDMP